jgi:hypothetical protein
MKRIYQKPEIKAVSIVLPKLLGDDSMTIPVYTESEDEINNPEDGSLLATGRSVQVFMDLQYNLVLLNPEFYEEWKKKWL